MRLVPEALLHRSHRIAWKDSPRYGCLAGSVHMISCWIQKLASIEDAPLLGRSLRAAGACVQSARRCGSLSLWLLGPLLQACLSHGHRIGQNGCDESTAYQMYPSGGCLACVVRADEVRCATSSRSGGRLCGCVTLIYNSGPQMLCTSREPRPLAMT